MIDKFPNPHENILPEITLRCKNERFYGSEPEDFEIIANGEVIGYLAFDYRQFPDFDPDQVKLADVRLNDEFRGPDKMFSQATYIKVIQYLRQKGLRLRSSQNLSKGSESVWQWLVANGYAEVLEEGERREGQEWIYNSTYKYSSL